MAIQHSLGTGHKFVEAREIIPSEGGTDDEKEGSLDLYGDDIVIGTFPVNVRTWVVYGSVPDASPDELINGSWSSFNTVVLGYEYEGQECPDWEELLRKEWISTVWDNRNR